MSGTANGLVIRGHVGIGPAVRGTALAAADDFSTRYDLDRDEGFSVICRDIKRLVDVHGSTGFIEGFLTIYGQKQLIVSDVLTGGVGEGGGNSLHAYDVTERRSGARVSPMSEPQ